jgi:hypothetical protein
VKTNLSSRKNQPPTRRCAPSRASPPLPAGRVLFIGLDVHNDSIAVSLAPSDSTEVRRYGIIGGEHDDVLKLVKKLQAAHPGTLLKFCYEAGPRGFALCRCLRAHGLDCILVCPSKVPRKPGERVKTDRRDADQLARFNRSSSSNRGRWTRMISGPKNLFMSIRGHSWLNVSGKYGFKKTRPALPRIRGQ